MTTQQQKEEAVKIYIGNFLDCSQVMNLLLKLFDDVR